MSRSPNLDLPFIMPSQAQKHITHNEALSRLDDILHITITSQSESLPPAMPIEGEKFVVGLDPEGAWLNQSGKLAIYRDSQWQFEVLRAGWIVWDKALSQAFIFDGVGLSRFESAYVETDKIGINTQADTINRLSVKTDAALFSHDDVTPGSGNVRLAINKQSEDDTGSIIFQNDFSGCAELGVSGSDNFTIKVSEDGQSWKTAIKIDRKTGEVNFPQSPDYPHTPSYALVNYLEGSGRFAGVPEPRSVGVTSFSIPSYINSINGSVFSEGEKFIHDNGTYGGNAANLQPVMDDLITKLRSPNARRFGPEFYSLEITAGTGSSASPVQINGQYHYLTFLTVSAPMFPQYTLNYYIRVISGAAAIGAGQDIYFDGEAKGQDNIAVPNDNEWVQVTQSKPSNVSESLGYHSSFFRIYAVPGTVYHLALPSLMPNLIPLAAGQNLGLIPSANLWL
ncbi:uncharacterized protein DUF2793 [Litorimonas taeanensis]|uniref:Uncharacterized protein DUF2793 n=1 Tax=Litorimonas taeanensis TaxID=568099 RepID=A0A420WDR5_9PROT|nr:DUF2793 domain-containing protein [Litorimonas taeanensis]RKQ69095.1 uncharacterized protein DUF2793 [Litorimonas taeanensis]